MLRMNLLCVDPSAIVSMAGEAKLAMYVPPYKLEFQTHYLLLSSLPLFILLGLASSANEVAGVNGAVLGGRACFQCCGKGKSASRASPITVRRAPSP